MLIVSISRTEAAPMPIATARRRMIGASRSRWAAERVLESRTPGIRRTWGFMITAAATTAPQVGATPTSSMPATRTAPSRQWTFSYRRLGTRGAIGGSGYPGRPLRSAPGASLPEGRGLAHAIAEEVQLCAPRPAVPDDLDLLDTRAVDHEGSLHADAARDLANRDRSRDPAAPQAHDGALEDLDPLLAALHDLGRHLDRVARGELRQVGADLVGDDLVEHVHGGSSCGVGARRRGWWSIWGRP